jgi:hypothetical protein
LFGRWFYDAWLQGWMGNRWGRSQARGPNSEPAHGDPDTPPR